MGFLTEIEKKSKIMFNNILFLNNENFFVIKHCKDIKLSMINPENIIDGNSIYCGYNYDNVKNNNVIKLDDFVKNFSKHNTNNISTNFVILFPMRFNDADVETLNNIMFWHLSEKKDSEKSLNNFSISKTIVNKSLEINNKAFLADIAKIFSLPAVFHKQIMMFYIESNDFDCIANNNVPHLKGFGKAGVDTKIYSYVKLEKIVKQVDVVEKNDEKNYLNIKNIVSFVHDTYFRMTHNKSISMFNSNGIVDSLYNDYEINKNFVEFNFEERIFLTELIHQLVKSGKNIPVNMFDFICLSINEVDDNIPVFEQLMKKNEIVMDIIDNYAYNKI